MYILKAPYVHFVKYQWKNLSHHLSAFDTALGFSLKNLLEGFLPTNIGDFHSNSFLFYFWWVYEVVSFCFTYPVLLTLPAPLPHLPTSILFNLSSPRTSPFTLYHLWVFVPLLPKTHPIPWLLSFFLDSVDTYSNLNTEIQTFRVRSVYSIGLSGLVHMYIWYIPNCPRLLSRKSHRAQSKATVE